MKVVSGTEIEKINDSFYEEYTKLKSLLFAGYDKRTIDDKAVKVAVDKCIIELKRFNNLSRIS